MAASTTLKILQTKPNFSKTKSIRRKLIPIPSSHDQDLSSKQHLFGGWSVLLNKFNKCYEWNVRENFLFNTDSSSSVPLLSLRNVVSSPFTFFLRLLQPKAQHCVPNFPLFLTAYIKQLWSLCCESCHSNVAPIQFRGLHFLPLATYKLLDPVLFFRSVVQG